MSTATNRLAQQFFLAAAMSLGVVTSAIAATVTNGDDTDYTLIVTEGGEQMQLLIGPGETIEICPNGCFVVMPNGDREVLTGSERLEINAGRGRIF